ncbi:hypothetical protein CC78DRAFT_451341, partial [Lojkania enalia]
LSDLSITIFDQRSSDWHQTQRLGNSHTSSKKYLSWKLACLEEADVIALYLQPVLISSSDMLELRIYSSSGKLVVCCPEGLWRRGDVEIVCQDFASGDNGKAEGGC